ncbi:ATP-binding protein [Cellulosilyticum sp. I15G10I2]|uniref:ATP-binding protein n=1 Tax=Cellulosilyticum sp. I15G10I2 TaxID=1892843 RepID=UPI00085CC7E0|nr:ATP-binding protein [Cellulosilyticum sp. I15G10I2]
MGFILYTSLNHDPIVKSVYELRKNWDDVLYDEVLALLLEKNCELPLGGNLFKTYICYMIAADENLFSLTAEHFGREMDKKLYQLGLRDMRLFIDLWQCDIINEALNDNNDMPFLNTIYKSFADHLQEEQLVAYLAEYYKQYGAGKMNRFKAFKWEKEKLIGITQSDPIRLNELIACDYQKQALIQNTESFLKGQAANNVLLFGDSGTGKSSCVKALLNEYHHKGLRMIELSKSDFLYFNKILASLRNRGLKFIIFLDDLSFEEFETEYKHMKALIEGGVEIKPDNVLIYATSNRRHLVRETWQERQGEDVHIADTQQEKLSLSDRFGLALTFTSPNQNTYLQIVFELAKKYQLDIPENRLREKAIQWELLHGGRSGRVAKQFINSLM